MGLSVRCLADEKQGFPLKRNDSFKLNLFPNPASENLTFTSAEKILELNIYDILGEDVFHKQLCNDIFEINISRLTKGTYIIRAKTQSNSIYLKFNKI